MSVSTKILLWVVIAVLTTCTLGSSLLFGARAGRQIRERLLASQEQLDALNRLDDRAWHYVNTLGQTRERGRDTTLILREYEAQLEAEQAQLERSLRQERELGVNRELEPREEEEQQLQQVLQMMRLWAQRAEVRIRAEPEGVPVTSVVLWELYRDYKQGVGEYISSIHAEEQEERVQMRRQWEMVAHRAVLIARIVTIGCSVLLIVMALALLLPLRGSLRELRTAAEHIGRGNFEVAVSPMGKDELGLLGKAMNRMASELRDTLQEKQRLVKAEAEASEREARRYSAMLEETVRARTAELETANARLEESFRQLQATQEQLLFADRLAAVGRVAAGVGHEINNPLSYIISNLRFIQGEVSRMEPAAIPERQELMDALAGVSDGAERIRLIVQDLKTLSRPDDVRLDAVELEPVARSAARFAEPELRPCARLVVDCDDVPPIRGNGPRLVQVLLNLLINAAHSISPGRVEENEIRLIARRSGSGQVAVEVTDTGSGIPPENLERIFEPFFTTKPVGVGTGLGLSLCRSLIASMGGSIQVESQLGRGTTFRLTLAVA